LKRNDFIGHIASNRRAKARKRIRRQKTEKAVLYRKHCNKYTITTTPKEKVVLFKETFFSLPLEVNLKDINNKLYSN
ncbi:hypothetical protein CCHL11_10059, partial [Colletotrichum chlorophyti]